VPNSEHGTMAHLQAYKHRTYINKNMKREFNTNTVNTRQCCCIPQRANYLLATLEKHRRARTDKQWIYHPNH